MSVLAGIAAGAAGTTALNVTTYLDMAIRGRPASGVPMKAVETLAGAAGIDLKGDAQDERQVEQNRKEGLGQLFGYATGLAFGAVYGALRERYAPSTTLAGIALAAAVMAGSDVPATALRLTDPRTWGTEGWLADIVPHLAYGLATAATYDAIAARR